MTIKETERLVTLTIEYIAGCIDCDGSISIHKMKSDSGRAVRHELRLQMTNTNRAFLELFKEQFGGNINRVGHKHIGWKQAYAWRTQGPTAEKIIRECLPYLFIKRERAQVGLKFRETFTGMPHGQGVRMPEKLYLSREKAYDTMKRLNIRGVTV